jgi:hypothetical protein
MSKFAENQPPKKCLKWPQALAFYSPGVVSQEGQAQYEKISDYTAKTPRNFGKM